MGCCYLALCLVAGILWADAGGGSLPLWLELAAASVAFAFILGIGSATLARRSAGLRRCRFGDGARASILTPWFGLLIAGLMSFDAGWVALDARLGAARRDRARAEAAAAEPPVIVEATVSSRRQGRFGDRVELSQVRPVGTGSGWVSVSEIALPSRLVLGLDAPERAAKATRVSRADRLLWPGRRVRLGLRVAPIHGKRNPGSPDPDRVAARRGLAARARLIDSEWVLVQSDSMLGHRSLRERSEQLRDALRRWVGGGLAEGGDESGLARALVLGDRRAVSPQAIESFRTLGLSHVLAVSGLHIGLVAVGIGWAALRLWGLCGRRVVDPFPGAVFVALLGSGLYAWLVGGSVSTGRAWLGLAILGILALVRRAVRPVELLAGIALAMLAIDPAALFDLGAELSFAACLGLVAAGVWRGSLVSAAPSDRDASSTTRATKHIGRVRKLFCVGVCVGVCVGLASRLSVGLRRVLGGGFKNGLKVSSAAGFGTSLVLLGHGLPTAWPGPIANAVVLPWAAGLVLPASLIAGGLAGGFAGWTVFFGDAIGASGIPGLRVLLWPGEGLIGFSNWIATRIPESSGLGLPSAIGVGIVSLVGLVSLRVGWGWRALACWAALVLLDGAPRADPGILASRPRVWFFDVGQGDAALVEGRTRSMLIDSGPGWIDGTGGMALVRALRSLGRDSIDVFVLTHADLDHRGGAIRILEELAIGALWLPVSGRDDDVLMRLAEVARDRGTRVEWRHAEVGPRGIGDLDVEVLWPPDDRIRRTRNAGSLVVRVAVAGYAFLFLADIGAAIERELLAQRPASLRADYVKISHHGSRSGTPSELLEHVAARHAIVSAPCAPNRGLPSSETLERIRRSSSRLWWTGRDGAIAIFPERSGHVGEVVSWGEARRCPE